MLLSKEKKVYFVSETAGKRVLQCAPMGDGLLCAGTSRVPFGAFKLAQVAGKTVLQVVGSSDLQHEQITIQLSQIQDDLSQLKRDGVSCKCIIS